MTLYIGQYWWGVTQGTILSIDRFDSTIKIINSDEQDSYSVDPATTSKVLIGDSCIQIHKLKTESKYFKKVVDGTKPFEVRVDDRYFRVDDILFLEEYTAETKEFSGNTICKKITYILGREPDEKKFVAEGYVVLGIV